MTTVFEAGPEFKIVAENDLADYTLSSPAVSDGQIFLRTTKYLYCIGNARRRASESERQTMRAIELREGWRWRVSRRRLLGVEPAPVGIRRRRPATGRTGAGRPPTGWRLATRPLRWSATENVRWKTDIPGLGHSSPVVWGDYIFLTTAIKTGAPAPAGAAAGRARRRRAAAGRGPGGSGPQVEHKFDVLGLDRKTGKILWQRTAKTAVPHEGGHNQYGSFASNSPVTDGKYVYAFFGSRGMYCYDFKGKLDLGEGLRRPDAHEDGVRRRHGARARRRQARPRVRSRRATPSWSCSTR